MNAQRSSRLVLSSAALGLLLAASHARTGHAQATAPKVATAVPVAAPALAPAGLVQVGSGATPKPMASAFASSSVRLRVTRFRRIMAYSSFDAG